MHNTHYFLYRGVGDLAFANAVAVTTGLAEVDGLVDLAVDGGPGGAGDIHVHAGLAIQSGS